MGGSPSQCFFPKTLHELFLIWEQYPTAVLYAGGTEILLGEQEFHPKLPSVLIFLGTVEELKKISRTERYLEIGALVPLAEFLALSRILPPFFSTVVEGIANPLILNLATVGGTIWTRQFITDIHGPLIVTDALYEIRDPQGSQWVAANRFLHLRQEELLAGKKVLSRIRIPLEQWNRYYYTRLDPYTSASSHRIHGSILMVGRVEKEVLNEFRFIVIGEHILRQREMELKLIGNQVPLEESIIKDALLTWQESNQEVQKREPYLWMVSVRALEEALLYSLSLPP